MTALLADAPSGAVVWIVTAVGVAALVAAIVVSVTTRRSRAARQPVRPDPSNGFPVEAAPAAERSSPAPFRSETMDEPSEGERSAAEPGSEPEPGSTQPEPQPEPAATPASRPAPEWMALWASPPTEVQGTPSQPAAPEIVTIGPVADRPQVPQPEALSATPTPSVTGDINLRGILRWLLFETDADAVVFHRETPAGERFYIEPRGLPDDGVAKLARLAREAMVAAGSGERAIGETSSTRWLGVGGPKLLLLTGAASPDTVESLRLSRFALEWLAASRSGVKPPPSEDLARTVPGVAWAEMATDGGLRVLPTEQQGEGLTADALAEMLPGQLLRWIIPAPQQDVEKRARLVAVNLSEMEGSPEAEVRLLWEGSELRGVGRGHTSLVGRHLAAARAAMNALKPLIHGHLQVEHLQVNTLPSEVEVVLVSVLVGDERLVGATVVRQEDEERAGAKAVLDAVNRRLVVLAGQRRQT